MMTYDEIKANGYAHIKAEVSSDIDVIKTLAGIVAACIADMEKDTNTNQKELIIGKEFIKAGFIKLCHSCDNNI